MQPRTERLDTRDIDATTTLTCQGTTHYTNLSSTLYATSISATSITREQIFGFRTEYTEIK